MKTEYYLDYYKKLTQVIPAYCKVSFEQDRNQLGDDATDLLIAAGTEFYLTGMVTNTLQTVGGDREAQDLLQDILEDFIQLYTNTNLLIIFCHRVEILQRLEAHNLIERSSLNQLNKIYEKVKTKLPFSAFPLTFMKKLKIKAGINTMERVTQGQIANAGIVNEIDIDKAKESLARIRTR